MTYTILAEIADKESEPEQAAEYRRLARKTRRDFAGTAYEMRRFAPEIAAIVGAIAGNQEAKTTVDQLVTQSKQAGGEAAAFVSAIERILAGERDAEALCSGLGYHFLHDHRNDPRSPGRSVRSSRFASQGRLTRMKPFHLQIQRVPASRQLSFQWFGQSAIHPAGSQELPQSVEAIPAAISDIFVVDLNPLLDDIASGAISDEEAFQAAVEFLFLRDFLAAEDFEELCETLYHFLWREAQARSRESIHKGEPPKAWSDPDHRLLRVWFATHRKPVLVGYKVVQFDDETSDDHITYGLCNVFVPKSHKPGSTGSSWWRRWLLLEKDDHLQVYSMRDLPRDIFWTEFTNKLQTWWDTGERNAFVFIHGFNVSFDEAAIRAAQISYDLKIPGEMAFYSWPSHGDTADYLADEATITASIPYIARFLSELSERSGAERIHLFVHSMGNRGFLSALERLVAEDHPKLRLGQIFFCAPDEDVRTFKDKATKFPHLFENRTLLVSPDDKAVALARWVHQHDRVGITPPVTTVEDMETIEVRGFGLLNMGHGYFASAEPVILDIRETIETGKRAIDRTIPRVLDNHFTIDIRQSP